jgi:hypothetical protein
MTTVLEVQATPVQPPRRRRWWPWAAVVLLILALIGAGTAGLIYAHTYAPLWSGGGSTASLTPKTLKIETAAGQQIQYVLVGPPGTVGTSYFTLTNNGRYPVTVQGAFSHDPYTDATLSWAPESPFTEAISGPSRPFPTTIRHNQAIAIETSETQPNCKNGVDGRTTYAASISWSALGVHHVFDVPSGLGQEVMPIMTCPRASMLGFLATN